ncbi:MAG TPA: tetratricopeptide repeat protein, partial [Thermoanaerobaculia bacterium]
MTPSLPLLLALALLAAGSAPESAPSPVSSEAATLRNLGLAQLENERPAEAAATFRKLAQLAPGDPLPYANLAIAALRQQKSEEAQSWIAQALTRAPGRADLLMIQGDVLQWSGQDEEALAAYRKAAAAAPDRVDLQYSLYRQAAQLSGPEAEAALADALKSLARLRPENLVVLLQAGQRAIAAGDRAGATRAFLRVRELAGTASPAASAALGPVMAALESGDVAAARVPAIRLENVLKPTAPY